MVPYFILISRVTTTEKKKVHPKTCPDSNAIRTEKHLCLSTADFKMLIKFLKKFYYLGKFNTNIVQGILIPGTY